MLEDEQENKECLHDDMLVQVRHVESTSADVVEAVEGLLHESPLPSR